MHQGQALGAGGRVGAGPGGGGADAGAHGRMLRLHRDELRLQLAVGHQRGEMLHDMGLGGDGISGDGLGPGQLHRVAHRDGDFHADSMGHLAIPSSGTMLMHPVTHSLAQMPQPLQ